MTKQNPIDEALGLRNIEDAEEIKLPVVEKQPPVNLPDTIEHGVEDDETFADIETTRSNIKSIIEQGGDSLVEIIALAKQSESPRAFEVAGAIMKTLLDANKDFLEVSMKKREHKEELTNPKDKNGNLTNVTNNNLILSTKDLLNMIKGENLK